MERTRTPWMVTVQRGFQIVSIGLVLLIALALTVTTALAIAGLLPWVEIPLSINGQPFDYAGMVGQILLTVFVLLLCTYLPSNLRVLRLEQSHRNFQVRMEDVANAYWAVHRADRTGVFKMKSEFDAVKERLLWLRDHPDLHSLEPEVLEMAAQMSRQSEELARIYSDETVAHAKEMLEQRIHEANRLEAMIEHAHAVTRDIRQAVDTVEIEEDVVASRMERLKADLADTLGRLGLTPADIYAANTDSTDVIHLPAPTGRRPSVSVAAE